MTMQSPLQLLMPAEAPLIFSTYVVFYGVRKEKWEGEGGCERRRSCGRCWRRARTGTGTGIRDLG